MAAQIMERHLHFKIKIRLKSERKQIKEEIWTIQFRRAYMMRIIQMVMVIGLQVLISSALMVSAPFAQETLYVTSQAGIIYVIDAQTESVLQEIPIGSDTLFDIEASPSGFKLFVTSPETHELIVVDSTINQIERRLDVGKRPLGVAVTPDGLKVYVANYWENMISVVNTATWEVKGIQTDFNRNQAAAIACRPDGKYVYVGANEDNRIAVIDTSSDSIVQFIEAKSYVYGIETSPAGMLYASTYYGNSIDVINMSTNLVVSRIAMENGTFPWGLSLGIEGKYLYVLGEHDASFSAIDIQKGTVVHKETTAAVYEIATNPVSGHLYIPIPSADGMDIIDPVTFQHSWIPYLDRPMKVAVLLAHNTGVVRGRVTTTIPGKVTGISQAEVSLAGTTYRTFTDDEGNYQLSGVDEGVYDLRIQANPDYFDPVVLENLVVRRMERTEKSINLDEMKETQIILNNCDGDEQFTLKDVIYGLQVLSGVHP